MSYIIKTDKKHYVIQDFGDDIMDLCERDEIFEVDELLAYPIAELCNKGYITKMSCSGHAFSSPSFERISEEDVLENEGKVILLKEYLSDYESNYVCYQCGPNLGTFIEFEKDIAFQNLPVGWEYKNRFLRFNLPMQKNPSLYYFKLMSGIMSLTEWIENLQILKG